MTTRCEFFFLLLKRNAVLFGLFGKREILPRSFRVNMASSMLIATLYKARIDILVKIFVKFFPRSNTCRLAVTAI